MPDDYAWAGGREQWLCLGASSDAPVVVVAAALFEEANRLRTFSVGVMRALAARGIASVLPDLPGTNDSLVPTEEARLEDWRAACAAAVAAQTGPVYGLALRGGALVDGTANLAGRYHFAPATGAELVRDLVRIRRAGAREGGDAFDPAEIDRPGPPILLAGNAIARPMLTALRDAVPSVADRTARLEGDKDPADQRFTAAPLWRRAEPGMDSALAVSVADDVAGWIARCGG